MSLENKLGELEAMLPSQLRAVWRDVYRSVAPDISPGLMRLAIANRMQERAHGRLSSSTVRQISRMQQRLMKGDSLADERSVTLKPGTQLLREWKDRSYRVLVLDDGFEYENRHYQSLSHIAREITGAHWSGPRFFGLKKHSDYKPRISV